MRPAKAGGPGAPTQWAGENGSPEPAPATAGAAKPRLARALKRGVRAAYDYLGTVIVSSAVWIGLAVLLGTGGSSLGALATEGRGSAAALFASLGGVAAAGIGTGPLTAALFHHTRRLFLHEDPYWWELATAVGKLWRRGLTLAAVQIAVSLVLLVDGVFFLAQAAPLLRLCGAVFIYPLLFWWGACLLQWPLSVESPEDRLWQVIKKSFLLFLDNLIYMCLFSGAIMLLTFVCVQTTIGRFVLTLAWAGTLAFLQTAAFRELLPKYGLLTAVPADEQESDR